MKILQISESRMLKVRQAQFPILAISKRYLSHQSKNWMNKNFLESNAKDSAMSQENVVHEQSQLEKLIELNTKTIGMMAQMMETMNEPEISIQSSLIFLNCSVL